MDELRERLAHGQRNEKISKGTYLCLPFDYTTEYIPILGRAWLDSYSISLEDIQKYRFGYSEKLNRLILPLYDREGNLIFWQGRNLSKPTKDNPKYINMRGPKGKYATFSSSENNKAVCLVEDILSAIKVSKVVDSIPLLGSYISNSLLTYLQPYDKIYCWLDEDKRFESMKYAQKVRLLTGKPCHTIITKLDPKEYNVEEIRRFLYD